MVAPGQLLSHFRLAEQIGSGGMGVVYRAHDEHLERDVAVKVLSPGLLADESARRRFRKEALALSKLNHPSIATIYDFDSAEGTDFLVMEYVPGAELSEKLRAGGLEEDEIVRFGVQLLDGLAVAHEKGIVHRDLKPGNIRITNDGRLKILDFGLAKLLMPSGETATETATTQTRTRGIVGTVPYMAPEQLGGGPVDARTDLYASGCVLYEMATGRRPFTQSETGQLLYAIVHELPAAPRKINPSVSPDLEALILKAIAKDPAKRYQSARGLAEDLERLGAGVAVAAPRWRAGGGRRRLAGAGVFLIAVVAVFLALDVGGLRSRWIGGGRSQRIESMAVLPLENLSGDPSQEYFADGMTEALIIDLCKIGALSVIARHSVMRFKGTERSLAQVAADLGVDALIVGTIQPASGRIRVTAHLFDVGRDETVWSDRFDGDMRDVLDLQSEIARAIANQVQAVLTPREEARMAASRQVDPEAHRAYLLARHPGSRFNRDGIAKAMETLEKAVSIAPDFAEAWGYLAWARFVNSFHYAKPEWTGIEDARAAANRALEIDESVADALITLGYIRQFHDWDPRGAEKAYKRAVELNPSHSYAHSAYAYLLAALGRREEAIVEGRRGVELDPLSLLAGSHLAEHYFMVRDWQSAIAEAERVIELNPESPRPYRILRWVHESTGDYAKAAGAYSKEMSLRGSDPTRSEALTRGYEEEGAEGYWRAFMASRPDRPFVVAYAHAGLGNADEALAWLERAYEDRSGNLAGLCSFAVFDPLRDDPRFQDLLRRLNLAD